MSKEPLVLVADDDQHLAEFFQMALGKEWRVVLAEDGLQAVECARSESPDLILMDINMPRLNGWEAIREIRAMGIGVPIVVMTGFRDLSDELRAQELGVVECLYKPFNILRLREQIHRQTGPYLAAQESKKSHKAYTLGIRDLVLRIHSHGTLKTRCPAGAWIGILTHDFRMPRH